MTYLFVPFPMTLDDLEGRSPNTGLIKCNSTNIKGDIQHSFNCHGASRGPSAIAELFVALCNDVECGLIQAIHLNLFKKKNIIHNVNPLYTPLWHIFYFSFLPRDAMHPRYQPWACVCLSVSVCVCVCLSVTSRSSTKTAKRRITQTTPHDSPGTLVF